MKLGPEIAAHLYIEYLKNKNYSVSTQERYYYELKIFFNWLKETLKKDDIRDITTIDILSYFKYLKKCRTKNGKKYSSVTLDSNRGTLKGFFKFLFRSEYIILNPFDRLDLRIKVKKKLRNCLSQKKINDFIDSIKPVRPIDIRDRTILELMYGAGLRAGEVSKLVINDLDLQSGKLLVRQGKWKKDRIVPLGNNLIIWIKRYLKTRSRLLKKVKEGSIKERLFLSTRGSGISVSIIHHMIKRRIKLSGMKITLCSHMLRHSFATHILENGAKLKHVKDILGHKKIESTTVYTHFNVKSLKRIMKMYNPRENELYEEFKEDEYIKILED